MGDPDLILKSRIASNHDGRRDRVHTLVIGLLVVDNFTECIPSREEPPLNTLFSEMLLLLSLLVKRTPVLDLRKGLVQPSVVKKGHHLILTDLLLDLVIERLLGVIQLFESLYLIYEKVSITAHKRIFSASF